MSTGKGFSNQKKKGIAQYETVHNLGSSSYGQVSAPKNLYDISLTAQAIVSVADVIGRDGQVSAWNIEVTAHGASVGNVVRFITGNLKSWEFEIVYIKDADHFYVLPISDALPIAGNTVKVMGWITSKTDEQGNPIVTSGPVRYLKDAVSTEVEEDTATPANNDFLPVKIGEEATGNFLVPNADGSASVFVKNALIPNDYDDVVIAYVGVTTDIASVIYKKGGMTVATLNFTYDGTNRLIDVART